MHCIPHRQEAVPYRKTSVNTYIIEKIIELENDRFVKPMEIIGSDNTQIPQTTIHQSNQNHLSDFVYPVS